MGLTHSTHVENHPRLYRDEPTFQPLDYPTAPEDTGREACAVNGTSWKNIYLHNRGSKTPSEISDNHRVDRSSQKADLTASSRLDFSAHDEQQGFLADGAPYQPTYLTQARNRDISLHRNPHASLGQGLDAASLYCRLRVLFKGTFFHWVENTIVWWSWSELCLRRSPRT